MRVNRGRLGSSIVTVFYCSRTETNNACCRTKRSTVIREYHLYSSWWTSRTKGNYLKKKVWFYIALYPVRWTAQSALHFPPLTDLFMNSDTVLGFSWKHSSHAAIAQWLFTHISTTVYSQVLIYTAESTGASWRERKCPNFETVTTGIWTLALSIASSALYHWATVLHFRSRLELSKLSKAYTEYSSLWPPPSQNCTLKILIFNDPVRNAMYHNQQI